MKPDDQKPRYTYKAGDALSPTPSAPPRGSLYRKEVSRKIQEEEPPAAPLPESYEPPVYREATPTYREAPPSDREAMPAEPVPAREAGYTDTPYDGSTSYTDISAYEEYAKAAPPPDAPTYGEPEYNEFGYQEYAPEGGEDDYGPILSRTKPAYDLDYFAQGEALGAAPGEDRQRQPRRQKMPRERAGGGGRRAPRRAVPAGYDGYGAERVSVGRRVGRVAARTGIVVAVFVIAFVVLAFGVITVICKGPFPSAKEKFVVSVTETSAVKWLANIYFSPEQVEEILAANAVLPPEETTDTEAPFETNVEEEVKQDIEIVDIKGSTYVGKLMIINDPTRVRLAVLPQFGNDIDGMKVEDFVAANNAVGGINAGGFMDLNGMGRGGQPLGMVIKDGVILSGSAATTCNMIGFTAEGQLLVGVMSGQEALNKGMIDGVYFEPTLIVNGQPAEVSGNGGGLNPRTVIGQRDDGAVLFLVIDGRQPHSLGASLQDCMQEMLDAGAVNASNLDGGSSSVMFYQGEMLNVSASLYGSRGQPACWIIQ